MGRWKWDEMHGRGMQAEGQTKRVKETARPSYPAKQGCRQTYLLDLVHGG